VKLISWNVNGLRACIKKGFFDFVGETSPDILALQETKMRPSLKRTRVNIPFTGTARRKKGIPAQPFL
jgi:exonuclease III